MPPSSLTIVALLVAAATAQFDGVATTYGPPDGESPQGGNCALMSWLDFAPRFHVAMNDKQWSSGIHCGRCVAVKCTDTRCTSRETVMGQITDRCPECSFGDLDMSLPMFNKITGFNTDRLKIHWDFVDCPVRGGVQVCAKSGSSKHWLYVQASNSIQGVASMSINGAPAPVFDSAYYFMSQVLGTVELGDTQIKMTSHGGSTISTKVSLVANTCTQIPQQFTSGSNPAPPPYNPPPVTPAPPPPATSAPPTRPPATPTPPTQPPATPAPPTQPPVTPSPPTPPPATPRPPTTPPVTPAPPTTTKTPTTTQSTTTKTPTTTLSTTTKTPTTTTTPQPVASTTTLTPATTTMSPDTTVAPTTEEPTTVAPETINETNLGSTTISPPDTNSTSEKLVGSTGTEKTGEPTSKPADQFHAEEAPVTAPSTNQDGSTSNAAQTSTSAPISQNQISVKSTTKSMGSSNIIAITFGCACLVGMTVVAIMAIRARRRIQERKNIERESDNFSMRSHSEVHVLGKNPTHDIAIL